MIDAVMRALGMGLAMGWEILWPLILGFALAGYPPDCPGRHCGHCADADRLGDGGGVAPSRTVPSTSDRPPKDRLATSAIPR